MSFITIKNLRSDDKFLEIDMKNGFDENKNEFEK